MNEKKLVINDANILFDLISVGLLESFCKVPVEIYTTDFVIHEIKQTDQIMAVESCISNHQIIEKQLSFEELLKISQLQQKEHVKSLSYTDCSVWYLAKELNGILLTGDSKLRKIALEDSIEVHGILYALNLIVNNKIVPAKTMAEKLKSLMKINNRLPAAECERLIAEWNSPIVQSL